MNEEWRETAKGGYWKWGDYRIEYDKRQYQAGCFSDKRDWTEYQPIDIFSTLQEAKEACENHARMDRNS